MNSSLQDGATGRNSPMRALIEQNRERGVEPLARRDLPWATLSLLGALAIGAALVACWLRRRGRRGRPPAERAFLKMSRKLGLEKEGRELIKQLAAECAVEPLTLLVSPSALHDAIARVDRDRWRSRKGWKRVIALADAA